MSEGWRRTSQMGRKAPEKDSAEVDIIKSGKIGTRTEHRALATDH